MKSAISFFSNFTTPKFILTIIASLTTIFMDLKTALMGLLVLIIIDLFTGIIKSYYVKKIPLNPFKKIFYTSLKSNGLRQTWKKTYEYFFGVIAVAVIEYSLIGKVLIDLLEKQYTLTELAIVVAGGIEVWSIFENLEAVSKNNMLKRLLEFLPEKLQLLFKGKVEEKDVEVEKPQAE